MSQNQVMNGLVHRTSEFRRDERGNDFLSLALMIAFVLLSSVVLYTGAGGDVKVLLQILTGKSLLIAIGGTAIYASILWVLGVLVIRERRRARYSKLIPKMVLPYLTSPYKR